ncbi:MAG TPA: substrate-binding domain-containing protein [Pseudonocardia sp.]|nr:substrate-binding domain-containing protein [Pseudonocardia sp.]
MASHARPTLALVAARAGVSPSTASLAFAGSPRVTDDTRRRVLEAAAQLGYPGPDPLAASLRRGRSGVVGVFIAERLRTAFRDPHAVVLMDGIAEVLGPHGVGLLLLAGDTTRPSPPQLGRIPLDAAIFATCGSEDDPAMELLRNRGVPIVGVDGPVADGITLIDINDREGTSEVATHLHGLGHRRAAIVAMPLRLDGTRGWVTPERRARIDYRDVRSRLDGVEDVFGPVPAYETASNVVDEGELAGIVLLDVPADRRPTAIFAQSDILAAGVLRAADRTGVRVPDDLSVVGFDGAELPWLSPTVLSTVVQPTERKGQLAASAVVELLAGRHPPSVTLPVTVRLGTTSGPSPVTVQP